MTPEGRVKLAVKKFLNSMKAYHHWPVQAGYGKPCLDCHGCWRGKYYAIETKAPGKKMTARQEQTASEIRAAGGKVFVIDTTDQTEAGFRLLTEWMTGD